jgi:hypothetical protein
MSGDAEHMSAGASARAISPGLLQPFPVFINSLAIKAFAILKSWGHSGGGKNTNVRDQLLGFEDGGDPDAASER